jgi:hypothetical protein
MRISTPFRRVLTRRRQDPFLDKALDTPDIAAARADRDLGFRKDINGLRALAVLGVVAFHADRALVPGGFAGVDVFFVISGFLITRIILSECAASRFSRRSTPNAPGASCLLSSLS